MALNLNGWVLRPAKLAPGNSPSTGEATSGVSRDTITPAELSALGYQSLPLEVVEPWADMYRASTLEKPDSRRYSEEYLLWAANTASLSTIESDAFVIAGQPDWVVPAREGLSVGGFDDGTKTFFVQDAGGRDLSKVTSLILSKKTGLLTSQKFVLFEEPELSATAGFVNAEPTIGKITLNQKAIADFGGGFSLDRGDLILGTTYILSGPKFWWTKNEFGVTRFGWRGLTSRWEAYRGTSPQNLGAAQTEGGDYKLSPPPTRFQAGDVLPGTPGDPQGYALVRAGVYPDSTGEPLQVLVVSDEEAEGATYPSVGAAYDAVVGVSNGVLALNPAWVSTRAGITLWYNPESFTAENDGVLGPLAGLPQDSTLGQYVLAPVPGPTDRPLVRLGYRRYLTPIPVDQDSDLPLPTGVLGGEFYWSRSTGKILLSSEDIQRATPGTGLYDIAYLGCKVYYDGVSLTAQPLVVKEPTPALNESGDPLVGTQAGGVGLEIFGPVFIPRGSPLPPPGVSGVLFTPDGSGDKPEASPDPQTRPNGSGLERRLREFGDAFLFTQDRALEKLTSVEYDDEIPVLNFRIEKTEAVVSKGTPSTPTPGVPTSASRAELRRRGLKDQPLYFLQAQVSPCVWAGEARIFSRYSENWVLQGGETLPFIIDGTSYLWDAALLPPPANGESYTAQEIADSLNLVIGDDLAGVFRGRVFLKSSSLSSGSVEIGWNANPADFSGHAVLGFLPTWRVDLSGSTFRWLPDSGASFGLYRSPENLDRSSSVPDYRSTAVLGGGKTFGEILTESVPGSPYYTINNPPLEDVPGFDAGVHFLTVVGLNTTRLRNWGLRSGIGVHYEWDDLRFGWTERGEVSSTLITGPANTLQLADTGVLPETLSSAAMDPTGPNYGLYLQKVGDVAYSEQVLGQDFVAPGEGAGGQAVLIEEQGGEVFAGGGGEATAPDMFSNPLFSLDPAEDLIQQTNFLNRVEVGFLLQVLNGANQGVYTITDKSFSGGKTILEVSPSFPETESALSWKVWEAQIPDVYDPTVLADVQLVPFLHWAEEPWKIRLLSPLGEVPSLVPAVVQGALASGREIAIRFGLAQAPPNEAQARFLLQGLRCGEVQAEGLEVPDPTNQHFELSPVGGSAYFQFRLGEKVYSTGLGNLAVVSTFTGNPNRIEVGGFGTLISGEIRVGSSVVSAGAGEILYFDEVFLSGSLLSAGQAEVHPSTGEVRLSFADELTWAGVEALFVETLVVAGNLDAQINPLIGSFYLNTPLREGQSVETEYWVADTAGDKKLNSAGDPIKVIQYLPMTVRLETATRVDSLNYSFNPTGRTLGGRGSEAIWVGPELQNFAGTTTATVGDDSIIRFLSPVAVDAEVQINYAVLEAFGGESSFSVSSFPVYRKPFFLLQDQDEFSLEGDRTDDVLPGQVFLLGPAVFYIISSTYSPLLSRTLVEIFPTPTVEVGSRSPGNEAQASLTNLPVLISEGGPEGFLLQVDQTTNPILPCNAGSLEIVFVGDVTTYAQPGHLLEAAGIPYLIIQSALVDEGRYTKVSISLPTWTAHTSADTLYLSVRRIYEAKPSAFVGIYPFLSTEPYRVFLLGSRNMLGAELPGRELVEGVHYVSEPENGGLTFLVQNQAGLQPWEKLYFSYVALRTVSPQVQEGAVIYPRFRAQYLYLATPSRRNRILGATLTAKYAFRNPDSFFCQILPLESYLPEVSKIALGKALPLGGGGPIIMAPGAENNAAQGIFGLRSEAQDLGDQDRAARAFIEFYNGVVVAFEQVLEAIDGRIIGDRDGKFRFFVGHDKRYPPPGWEDGITGDLNTRLLWREIQDAWSNSGYSANDGWFLEKDPVVDPTTAEVPDPIEHPGATDGVTPDPQRLDYFVQLQANLVRNDMDDRILVGFGRPRGLAFLFPKLNVPGLFRDMWQNHPLSRLFPERTKHFSRLLPGIGARSSTSGFRDSGYYTSGRKVTTPGPRPGEETESTVKTRLTAIGAVANPALGEIGGIQEVTARNRYPRARVWAYYPQGSAALDSAINAQISANYPGSSLVVSTVGRAVVVATPLVLAAFPTDEASGYPDITQLLFDSKDPGNPSTGGLFSLESGDADLSTPRFEPDQMIGWGKPSGSVFTLTDSRGNGIFVDAVLAGCIVTLKDVTGAPVTGSQILVEGSRALEDVVSGRGDTLFVGVPAEDLDKIPEEGDSPTLEQSQNLGRSLPDYSIQKDLIIQKGTGQLIDASWPTYGDAFPIPLQNWFGQNPPKPLTCIEGEVDFSNTRRKPLQLPCLKGEGADDAGDVSIPYLGGSETELDLLGEVAAGFRVLLGSDTPYPLPYTPPGGDPLLEVQDWKAVYPNELVFADGLILQAGSSPRDPATLYTGSNLRPVQTSGYSNGSGIGDLRRFDLLLVEVDQPLALSGEIYPGTTGILSVGEALWDSGLSGSTLEGPRFVTPAPLGGSHKYTLRGAWGSVFGSSPASAGLECSESNPGNWLTVLDFSTVANLFLDDGTGTNQGGVLGFLGSSGRALVIRIWNPDPAALPGSELLGALVLSGVTSPGSLWVWDALTSTSTLVALTGNITLTAQDILRLDTGSSILALLSGVSSGIIYDFTISLDAYYEAETSTYTGGGLTVGGSAGSQTCEVSRDRLTFSERVSLLSALPRGTFTANGNADVSAGLDVLEIQTSSLSDCSVNSCAEINAGVALSFQQRVGPSRDASPYILPGTPYTGTFVGASGAGLGDERGTLRAMSWEGHGNLPLNFASSQISGIRVSGVASSDLDLSSSAPILEGIGVIPDSVAPGELQTWVQNVVPASGALSNPVAGDVLVVSGDSGAQGAVKAGSYLIRHVIPNPDDQTTSGVDTTTFTTSTPAGSRVLLDLTFPQVKSFDLAGLGLVASGVPKVLYANSAGKRCGYPDPVALGANQWVYLVNQNQYATYDPAGPAYTIIPRAVYRAEYSDLAYNDATGEATFTLTGTFEDAEGTAITGEDFELAATAGKSLSGMVYFPLHPRGSTGLPPNNLVGAEDSAGFGTNLTAGFYSISGENKVPRYSGGATPTGRVWQKGSAREIEGLLSDSSSPTFSRVGVRIPLPENNESFYADRDRVIYARDLTPPFLPPTSPVRGVPAHISLEVLGSSWEDLHFDTSASIPTQQVNCLLPGDAFEVVLQAVSGIFLEPSFARPTTDIGSLLPHVVSSSFTASAALVGIRDIGSYTSSGASSESVSFYVRRIRRFHEVQANIASSLELLKWGYEMRRGAFSSYNSSTREFVALPGANGATNLGDFTESRININPGDILRVLDAGGNLLDSAEISKVLSGDTLKLRRPGLDSGALTGAAFFEVYLSTPLVPQEQSCEQLLDLITDREVFKREVDYAAGDTDGGFVPTDFNEMQDTLVPSWGTLGVQEGDYVVVDPAGTLYLPEEVGARPVGSTSVVGRSAFVAGTGPNALDDNRGFYRVGTLDPAQPEVLPVSGACRFAGSSEDGSDDVVFGTSGPPDSDYAVLPTVWGSALTGDREGQQSLRPTAAAVGGSFLSRSAPAAYKSIQPFGYRVIRPSPLFSQDAVELVLFMRERTLSWIEEVRSIYQNGRGGDYWTFQEGDHILDIGSPTDPADGKGVISNLVIASLEGLVGEAPFANVSDCLSVLDRRFWVLDSRLDSIVPSGGSTPYTQFADNDWDQRPVLPDLIEEVLNLQDRFRPTRYSWIAFRADRVSGSIVSKRRAESQLPEKLQDQQEYLDQKRGLDQT